MILVFFFGQIDKTKYNYLTLPIKDVWGVLMRKDDPLASFSSISPKDIIDKPLIISRQINTNSSIIKWLNTSVEKLNIISTYNLIYNASILVANGLGYAFTLDKLINTSGDSKLCFKPLSPKLDLEIHFVWKKYQIFSKAAEKFLEYMKEYLNK